jgi:hypothetical protein
MAAKKKVARKPVSPKSKAKAPKPDRAQQYEGELERYQTHPHARRMAFNPMGRKEG